MSKCPSCEKEWPADCEQGVSIEWHDECFACWFTPRGSNKGTIEEAKAIQTEAVKRKSNG